jgi:CheY-like chemotaxis protein
MSKKLKFIWIDDNPQRLDGAKTMADQLKVSVDFKDVKNKNLNDVLAAILRGNEPNLLIIDHNLEDASSGVFKKGSTAAAYIREQWPECPIICISGVDPGVVDSQQKALYEEILPIENISKFYQDILSIAKSFALVRNNKPNNVDEFIDLLNPPIQDRENLKSIIPTALKENFNDRGLAVEVSRWVRGVLLNRPGFVYNKLWASTLAGITPEAFTKMDKKFKKARYVGLFANTAGDRWWKSELLDCISLISNVRGLPWEKNRGIKGLSDKDFAKCYASGENYPETVAFIDEAKTSKEEPMKLKYTSLHPDYESLLFFDDIRLMNPAE